MRQILFENNRWFMAKARNGRSILLVSKTGKGTAEAFLTGQEQEYDALNMRNRGPRIVYRGIPVPVYLKAKVTTYFFRTGRRYR